MELRGSGPFPVKRFVEKPDLETALNYLTAGTFFWNSGMFIWRADTILEEIDTYLPDLSATLAEIKFSGDVWELSDLRLQIKAMYEKIESISIDYGIMEKSTRVLVVPVEMGWSDVGSWSALPEVVAADHNGTVCINSGEQVAINSENCIIYGNGQTIATVGVSNLIIVTTPDAVLVCDIEHAQDVKKVVEQLSARGKTDSIS